MNEIEMLQDIEYRVMGTLHDIIEEYGAPCSLAVPAVLLKVTLQIYKQVMENEEDISQIIMASLEHLDKVPPLIPQETIH